MKLESQVTSPELSNQLHQLGVTSLSMFFRDWTGAKANEIEQWPDDDGDYCPDNVNCYTVAELEEILPKFCYSQQVQSEPDDHRWQVDVPDGMLKNSDERFDADTEANARAKMLIYLLKNSLLVL